jgi:hypothetical protein
MRRQQQSRLSIRNWKEVQSERGANLIQRADGDGPEKSRKFPCTAPIELDDAASVRLSHDPERGV